MRKWRFVENATPAISRLELCKIQLGKDSQYRYELTIRTEFLLCILDQASSRRRTGGRRLCDFIFRFSAKMAVAEVVAS